jgi:hypothetical protein
MKDDSILTGTTKRPEVQHRKGVRPNHLSAAMYGVGLGLRIM